ncbi:general amino acid permease AGP2 [Ceratobasidium sp. AG-Ba]|nr:general amino acid permease AGP2 [Ceratobasidium sp. AG-Ba]
MAEQVIDLTLSDDNKSQQNGSNGAGVSAESGRRARRNRGSRNRQKSASENGGAEAVGSSQKHEASSSKESRHQLKSDKGGDPNQEPTRPNRSSNVASSLLSRIGDILHENEKENKSRRDRAPREGKERGRAISGGEPQTSSSKRSGRRSRSRSPKAPKEVALSELPVDQLFFIDTSPTTQGKEPGSEISTPLGAGASVPNEANVVSARALKHKQSKEHKKEQNLEAPVQVQGDVVGNDAAPEVEFIGGEALATDSVLASASTTHTTSEITPSTTAIVDSTRVEILKQTPDGTAVAATLALPPHVTLWTEGDPDVSLADVAAGGLDLEDGVEYIDFEDDQAAGVARYFLPDAAAATKKLCRTCGEEGHIAKNCKKLICLTCGERDDHDTRNCPMRVVCFNCGGKGHVVSTCPQPRGQHGCDRCGSYTHIHQRCLDQFKTYIYLSDSERLKILEERAKLENLPFGEGGEGYIARHIWCYNCGGPGHWGDECQESRQHNAPKDPCAFSSHNASRGPFGDISDEYVRARDAPRPAWMDDDPHLQGVGRRGKEASMKRNRAAEASRAADERDDDDWFSRKAGPSNGSRSLHSNKNNSGSGDKLPPKPKISFQFRDNEGRTSSDGRDRIRERHRDRGRNRDQDRDSDKRRMMAKNPIEGVSLETMTEGLGVHALMTVEMIGTGEDLSTMAP